MRVIVLGCEDLGANLASALVKSGHKVTIIDPSEDRLDSLLQQAQVDAMVASDSLMEDLRRVGMNNIDALVAISEDDNKNVMAAQVASHIFRVPEVVCRVNDPNREKIYRELGINVVCPSLILIDSFQRALEETSKVVQR
jgi:trk system potassium uptake protein TrkA